MILSLCLGAYQSLALNAQMIEIMKIRLNLNMESRLNSGFLSTDLNSGGYAEILKSILKGEDYRQKGFISQKVDSNRAILPILVQMNLSFSRGDNKLGYEICQSLNDPVYINTMLSCGEKANEEGDWQGAYKIYYALTFIDPDNGDVYRAAVRFSSLLGNQTASLSIMKRWIERDKNFTANDLSIITRRYEALGDYAQAKEWWEKAVRIFPESEVGLQGLAWNATASGDKQQALQYASRLVESFPNNSDALSNMASLYLQLSQFDQAAGLAQKVVSLDPKNSFAYYVLGYILSRKGTAMYAEARLNFEKAIHLDPNNFNYLYYYALTLRLREPTYALEISHRALDVSTNDRQKQRALDLINQLNNLNNAAP